jgi:zinc transporter
MQPGLIWGCARTADGTALIDDCEAHADAGFRWLHLNLADERTQRWLERATTLPEQVHALMLTRDTHQQVLVEDGVVGLVLQDFEREFDIAQTAQIGALHIVITPALMLTGRYHPMRAADLMRQRIAAGFAIGDGADALDLVVGTMVGGLGANPRAFGRHPDRRGRVSQ